MKSMTKPKFYITTAIPYANGAPHIGHAYERIATDVLARFKRLDGDDVLFVTGMDEHGQKMQQTAAREDLTPLQLAGRTAALFEAMGDQLAARADDIVRTTSARHKASVQDIWRRMQDNGDIYLSKYSGWYSVRDEAYYDLDEIDERDGRKFAAKSGTPVEWVEEESYFFKLSAYAEPLLAHYVAHPDFVTPENYRNEIVAFVKRGLKDLSISRTTFDWGIAVPGDPRHVMYVWIDALTNYITATGFPDAQAPRAGFWPADAHVIGKDITRFHAIYWPAFLMSAKLPLPKQVFGHGFLLARGGEKMSKSLGNVVDPLELADRFGVDALRYFFLREVSFGQDGSYSAEAIVGRGNTELGNAFGNLAQRVLSFIAKNLDGALPEIFGHTDADTALFDAVGRAVSQDIPAAFEDLALQQGIDHWLQACFACNQYVDEQAPWALRKTDPERMQTVLATLYISIAKLAVAILPVIPGKAGELLDTMGIPLANRTYAEIGAHWYSPLAESDFRLAAPVPLFPRLELPAEGEA